MHVYVNHGSATDDDSYKINKTGCLLALELQEAHVPRANINVTILMHI